MNKEEISKDLTEFMLDKKININHKQLSGIVDFIEQKFDSTKFDENDSLYVKQLKQQIYHLSVERSEYQELLHQKFLSRSNQTIAHQFGRLIIDFLKNPIKNFISLRELLSIYAQYLYRTSKKQPIIGRWKKYILKHFFPADAVKSNNMMNIQDVDRVIKSANSNPILLNSRCPLKLNLSHKTAKDIKVAVILDEFSFNSFKDEFVPIIITPKDWKAQFAQQKPDLFFCESAWSGVDSVERPWKGRIYSSINFKQENRTELLEIIKYCNENGIPTIFWNKEDPTHYPDREHDFVKTAQLFDFVFTTAQECVEKYKQDYKVNSVHALPFATNPKVFNPIKNDTERSKKVTFAGSWYANHIERSETMSQLFDNLIDSGYELEFYNRYYGDNDINHLIPEKYQKFEKPSVANKETSRIYKSSILGLNINTVVDSETMFARRVFELMSSNTLVLSNYSIGMDKLFGSNVIFLDKDADRLKKLSQHEITEIREQNLNEVLKNHTYTKRFETILNVVGIQYNKEISKVTLVVKVANQNQIENEIKIFNKKFTRDKFKLLMVLDEKVNGLDVADFYTKFNSNANINVISEAYIKKYTNLNFHCIETPFFILSDSLLELSEKIIEKALLHSSYIGTEFIALTPHQHGRYIFENEFVMNKVFAQNLRFIEALNKLNQKVNSQIYYIEQYEN